MIVDDAPVSTGRFNVGEADTYAWEVGEEALGASAFVLTVEPPDDQDPAPSAAKVLAGDVVDGAGTLTTAHPAALGQGFADASGRYILATPTNGDGDGSDERSGIWFVLIPRAPSLVLPPLPEGWVYEGWVVIDGVPVTTGRFPSPDVPDDFSGFSGTTGFMPPLPGEDFLQNAPDGLTFPTELRGRDVVVSVEPADDDSPAPFALKPLAGQVPADAIDHVEYELGNNAAALPTGTVTLSR